MNLTVRIVLGAVLTALLVGFWLVTLDSAHAKAVAVAVTILVIGPLAAVATFRRIGRRP